MASGEPCGLLNADSLLRRPHIYDCSAAELSGAGAEIPLDVRVHQNGWARATEPPDRDDNCSDGERKDAFGHTARRVITTRRDIPLDASGGTPSRTETDGWYIDLEARPSCERSEVTGRTVLLGSVTSPDAGRSYASPPRRSLLALFV